MEEREVRTRGRRCLHRRRIVPGRKISQEYVMCLRGVKEEETKVGRNLFPWVSDPRETLLAHDMFQII